MILNPVETSRKPEARMTWAARALLAVAVPYLLACALVGCRDRHAAQEAYRRSMDPAGEAVRNLPALRIPPLESGSGNASLQRHFVRIRSAADAEREAAELQALVDWIRKHGHVGRVAITLGERCPPLTDEGLLTLSGWPQHTLLLWGRCGDGDFVETSLTLKHGPNLLRLIPLAATRAPFSNEPRSQALMTLFEAYRGFRGTRAPDQAAAAGPMSHSPTVAEALGSLPDHHDPAAADPWLSEARTIDAFLAARKTGGRINAWVQLDMRCPPLTDEEIVALSRWPEPRLYVEWPHPTERVLLRETFTLRYPQHALRFLPLALATRDGLPVRDPD